MSKPITLSFSCDNLTLFGILLTPDQKTSKCIILCHGITVDKDEDGVFVELAAQLCDAGFAVFRFDFRGHGESEGSSIEMTVTGEIRDLNAGIKFLQEKGYTEFGILGASFAGGVIPYAIVQQQQIIKALVLWNPLLDYTDILHPTTAWNKENWGSAAFARVAQNGFTEIGSRKYKVGKALLDEMKALTPWKELQKIHIPVLFVHGDTDTYISFQDSVKYVHTTSNGTLEIIQGAEHGFHTKEAAEKADTVTVNFFKKYV